MISKPFAILLCKFNDQEPVHEIDYYKQLFTSAGAGTMNMVDYFRAISHDQVDIGDSKVFGWYTIDRKLSDYRDNTSGRNQLLQEARTLAADAKEVLSDFHSIVVCMPGTVASFGGLGGAALDDGGVRPDVAAQEMLHTFGLNHSRRNGSAQDYRDQWDVMSAVDACASTAIPSYGQGGPLINAANMDWLGWLAPDRTWTVNDGPSGTVVELRPLNRIDLPGYLVAQVGRYYLEFRAKEGWDAGIDEPAVLVHRLDWNGANSYWMANSSGNEALTMGSVFEANDIGSIVDTRVEVLNIDVAGRVAEVKVNYVEQSRRLGPDIPPNYRIAPAILIGGVPVDGPGWIFSGGRLVPVPPRGPLLEVVNGIVEACAVAASGNARTRLLATEEALARVERALMTQRREMFRTHVPAPVTEAKRPGH